MVYQNLVCSSDGGSWRNGDPGDVFLSPAYEGRGYKEEDNDTLCQQLAPELMSTTKF